MQNPETVQRCVTAIREQLPETHLPQVGIVLGTGLGNIAAKIIDPICIPYATLPYFPQSTVTSHAGQFIFGLLNKIPLVLQQGRCHLYEGYTPAEVCTGVRVMGELGIKSIVLTNAAGAINPLFSAGSLMLLDDHINFTGKSPLTGENYALWGDRFPDLSEIYNAHLNAIFEETARTKGIKLEKGVYIGIPGPQLETRAETRAYRLLGADAVGMSTVLEAIAAHHMGIAVAGIACLTNKNLPDAIQKTSLEDVIKTAELTSETLSLLLLKALPSIALQG